MTHPAWFDPDSPAYVSNVRRRKIVAFDHARDICWVDLLSRSEGHDAHYWRACGRAVC